MKKILAVILTLLYIGTSTGATMHMHYCMGKLAGSGFGHAKSEACGKCGMEKTEQENSACCKDDHHFIKGDTAQKTPDLNLQISQILSTALPASYFGGYSLGFVSTTEKSPTSKAPPNRACNTIYKRNCVFRI